MSAEPSRAATSSVKVDVSEVGREIFLVKVPEYVHRLCTEAGPSAKLGHVKVAAKDGNANGIPTNLVLEDIDGEGANLEGALELKPVEGLPIFSFVEREDAIPFTGSVRAMGSVRMPLNKVTLAIMKRRKLSAETPSRTILMTEEEQRVAIHHESLAVPTEQQRTLAAPKDPDELLEEVVQLFTADKPLWSMNDLERQTGQNAKMLKPILAKCCNYHTSGESFAKYQLKPGYGG